MLKSVLKDFMSAFGISRQALMAALSNGSGLELGGLLGSTLSMRDPPILGSKFEAEKVATGLSPVGPIWTPKKVML